MKKYTLTQKQKNFILEKVFPNVSEEHDLTFYKLIDLTEAFKKGKDINNKFTLELNDEMASDFSDICFLAFRLIGLKKDDEPNEDGLFAEALGDYFYDVSEGIVKE